MRQANVRRVCEQCGGFFVPRREAERLCDPCRKVGEGREDHETKLSFQRIRAFHRGYDAGVRGDAPPREPNPYLAPSVQAGFEHARATAARLAPLYARWPERRAA